MVTAKGNVCDHLSWVVAIESGFIARQDEHGKIYSRQFNKHTIALLCFGIVWPCANLTKPTLTGTCCPLGRCPSLPLGDGIMTNQITASAHATANLAATQPVQGKVDARFSLSDLYAKWDALGDVPIGDDECIEEVFLDFEVGTHREEIWHWFERQHPLFIVGDVMQGIRHQDDGTIQLLQSYGYFAGARDPKVKPDFSGRFMVRDTEDDADGFCIVGDDLDALVREALGYLEIASSQERGTVLKNVLGQVAALPFYIWANEDCDNKSDNFKKAKAIRLALFNEGGQSVHIVDADGVEVVDSEIEAHEALVKAGYFAGVRKPDVKPDFLGAFMVNDPKDPDGYALVGDDIETLILEASDHLIEPVANNNDSSIPGM